MEDHTAFGQGSLHINDSLIGTALPVKGGVFLFFYKRTVHQYVCQGHKRKVFYFLPKIAGIDPDGLVREGLMDLFYESSDLVPVGHVEGIAAAHGNAGDVGLTEFGKQLLSGRIVEGDPAADIPGDGIVAVLAAMAAACHPQDGAQAVAV